MLAGSRLGVCRGRLLAEMSQRSTMVPVLKRASRLPAAIQSCGSICVVYRADASHSRKRSRPRATRLLGTAIACALKLPTAPLNLPADPRRSRTAPSAAREW